MRKLIVALLFLFPVAAFGQAQIPLGGSIGVQGSAPTLCAAPVSLTSDANYTLTATQYACNAINITSTVALTATRTITAPQTVGQQFTFTNSTTGGQSLTVSAGSGSTVTIPNGSTYVVSDPSGNGYVQITGSGGASLSYPGLIYATSSTANSLATSVQFAPQMADSSGNIILDKFRTTAVNPGNVLNTNIIGANSGSSLGSGWPTGYVAANGNEALGQGNFPNSTVATDMVAIGDDATHNFIGAQVNATVGDPYDGNDTVVGESCAYGLPYAYEINCFGQKAWEDTNTSNPALYGAVGWAQDSSVDSIHGDWMDRIDNSIISGAFITRYMKTTENTFDSIIEGYANFICTGNDCPLAGSGISENDYDVVLSPSAWHGWNVDQFTSIGGGAGTYAIPSSALGEVDQLAPTNGGSYTYTGSGTPASCASFLSVTFSAPIQSGGTTATATPNCAYNPTTGTYSIIYFTGLPSGTDYVQTTQGATVANSTTITLSAANSNIQVGDTVSTNGETYLPANETVQSISGTTVVIGPSPALATSSGNIPIYFGHVPTFTINCTTNCSGSGFTGTVFLTNSGDNPSTYIGFQAGANASSNGGVNSVGGTTSVNYPATNVAAWGIQNAYGATGLNSVDLFGFNNAPSDANDSYMQFFGNSNNCSGCSYGFIGGNNTAGSGLTGFVALDPDGYAVLGSHILQWDQWALADKFGNIHANETITGYVSHPASAIVNANAGLVEITGSSTNITTLQVPSLFTGLTSALTPYLCVHLITDSPQTFTTGGNIANTVTTVADGMVTACYNNSLWSISGAGGVNSLTTTGNSGASTLTSGTLNIPNYGTAPKVMSYVWGDDGNPTPITTSNATYGFWKNLTGSAVTVTEVDCYSNDGTATVTLGYGNGSSSNIGTIVTGTACANTGTSNAVSVSVPNGDVLNFVPTGGSSARVSVFISFHN